MMPQNINKLIPSPIDFRDVPLSAIIDLEIPIPIEFVEPYDLTQKDQGATPQCVAYSGSTLKEYREKLEGNNIIFDPDWLYKECKKIDGIPYDMGTYFRSVLSVLKNTGAMPMGGDPTDLATIAKYRIAGYVQVDCIPEALKRAINAYGTVLMGFRGSNNGWMVALIKAPLQGEVIWGHATIAKGYKIEQIIGQNSWGEDWGDKGKFYVPLDYMPFEAWAVVKDLPNNWQDLLPNPVNKPVHQFDKNLYYGIVNPEVITLQNCYKWLGCMSKEVIASDHFGPKTLEATKVFQQRYGIPQTGYVGTLTRGKLNELFKN